jgi:uridine phosphorylase
LQADIPVDSFVMSKFGLGLDNMLRSYLIDEVSNLEMEDAFVKHTNWDVRKTLCNCLFRKTRKNNRKRQNTQRNHCYCRWFYGPQGRILRLNIQDESLNSKMDNFKFEENRITNLEMETAAIYGLSTL